LRWVHWWTGVVPKCGQKATAVPSRARVRRMYVPAIVLAIFAPDAEQTRPASEPRAASAGSDFGRGARGHRHHSRRWPAAPAHSGVDAFAESPSRRSVHADRPQCRLRRAHGCLQRARMPEADCGPPHGVQAQVSTALRVGKRRRIDRNGRRCRSQGSSHRHRASRRYVGRCRHRPGSCCAQCAGAHSVRHGRSGARATMLPMRLCAHCLTQPSQFRSRSHWTMGMWQTPEGSPQRWAGAPHMIAHRQGSR